MRVVSAAVAVLAVSTVAVVGGGREVAAQSSFVGSFAYVVSGDEHIHIFDVDSGRFVKNFTVPGARFVDIESTATGSFVVALDASGRVIRLDTATDSSHTSFGAPPDMTMLAIDPRATEVAVVANQSAARVVDLNLTGEPLQPDVAGATAIAVSPDSRTVLLTTADTLAYRPLEDGGVRGEASGLNLVNSVVPLGSGAVAVGGRVLSLYARSEPRRLATIDIGASTLPDGLAPINDFDLLAATEGKIIRVDTDTETVHTIATIDQLRGIDRLGDGRIVAHTADGRLKVIDPRTGQVVADLRVDADAKAVTVATAIKAQPPTSPTAPPSTPGPTTSEPAPAPTTSEPALEPSTTGGPPADGGSAASRRDRLAATGGEFARWVCLGTLLVLLGGLATYLARTRLRRT